MAVFEKNYAPRTWRNKPNTTTPVNEVNLNHLETGVNEMDNRIVILSQDKIDRSELEKNIKDIVVNKDKITKTYRDGSQVTYDTDLEKIAINFALDSENNLVMTLADGSQKKVPLSAFVDTYTFKSSSTITFTQNGKQISAIIPSGAIGQDQLNPTILSTIRQFTLDAQTAKGQAEQLATTAGGWAVGGVTGFENNNAKYFSERAKRYSKGGVDVGDATDNAEYFMNQAKVHAERAEAISHINETSFSINTDGHLILTLGEG